MKASMLIVLLTVSMTTGSIIINVRQDVNGNSCGCGTCPCSAGSGMANRSDEGSDQGTDNVADETTVETTTQRPSCDANLGWFEKSDHCYRISTETVNWNDARQACIDLGAKLFVPKDDQYANIVDPEMTNAGINYVFIGVSKNDQGQFVDNDGNNFPESNFSSKYGDCGEILRNSGFTILADSCDAPRNYMCQLY